MGDLITHNIMNKILPKKTTEYAIEKYGYDKIKWWKSKEAVVIQNHRMTMWAKDSHCHFCGIRTNSDTCSVDHVVPRSKGGTNHPNNLLLSCRTCNRLKGSMDYNVFVNIVTNISDRDSFLETVLRHRKMMKRELIPRLKKLEKDIKEAKEQAGIFSKELYEIKKEKRHGLQGRKSRRAEYNRLCKRIVDLKSEIKKIMDD